MRRIPDSLKNLPNQDAIDRLAPRRAHISFLCDRWFVVVVPRWLGKNGSLAHAGFVPIARDGFVSGCPSSNWICYKKCFGSLDGHLPKISSPWCSHSVDYVSICPAWGRRRHQSKHSKLLVTLVDIEVCIGGLIDSWQIQQ